MANLFNGTLNSNEIFGSIYNMIISQEVNDPKLNNAYNLVDKFRVDGTLYGDTKLYYAADVLPTYAWGNDTEASNLLALDRPADPKAQAITIDTFRQVRVTVDNYLSKRAWATEGAFSQFNSLMLRMLGEAKKIHETTLINSYVGTIESGATKGVVEIDVTTAKAGKTGEEANRLEAQAIAKGIADIKSDMADYSRDYNDYGFLRAFNDENLMVVFNVDYVNKITKQDLPTIFHKDIFGDMTERLPARYFGSQIDTSTKLAAISATTPAAGKPINSSTGAYTPGTNNANGKIISLVEKDVTVSGTTSHVLPGDELPAGATVGAGKQFVLGEFAIADSSIICKIISKDAIKFMSAFEVATSFFNSRALVENQYLTFGYSKPDYLMDECIVVVKAK